MGGPGDHPDDHLREPEATERRSVPKVGWADRDDLEMSRSSR